MSEVRVKFRVTKPLERERERVGKNSFGVREKPGGDGGSIAAAGKHEPAALKYALIFFLRLYTATFFYSHVFF